MLKNILMVIGTRPEAIKMAPLARKLQERRGVRLIMCSTGQHKELLFDALSDFGLRPDFHLDVMGKRQNEATLFSYMVEEITSILLRVTPDIVLVHGDTLSAAAASAACFFNKVPYGHVEAGLRSFNMHSPWPEEYNRKIISVGADLHFAPTNTARENLVSEGIDGEIVFVTGNTVIDALLQTRAQIGEGNRPKLKTNWGKAVNRHSFKKVVCITAHRRENFGEKLINICEGILQLAKGHPDILFVYPVHPNPQINKIVYKRLSGFQNVVLEKPLGYVEFVELMSATDLFLTDSGGIQEEAPALDKPVLVLRDTTERPEALAAGCIKLVGTDPFNIIKTTEHILTNPAEYQKMAEASCPYGDGTASVKISDILIDWLETNDN